MAAVDLSREERALSKTPNVTVTVSKDEPIERALRRFKRMCERAGIKKILRAKRHYEKPSEERRRDARKQVRNRRRAERKAQERQQRKMKKAGSQQRSRAVGVGMSEGPALD